MAHLGTAQLYLCFILNWKTHDLDVGLSKWKSSACQAHGCYDSGGIKAVELRRQWCLTKCKHGSMERSKMSMSSAVGLKVQTERNKMVDLTNFFTALVFISDPVKWLKETWTASCWIEQCIVGKLFHFCPPVRPRRRTADSLVNKKKKKSEGNIDSYFRKVARFVSRTDGQKFKAAGMQRVQQPISYVKSSLCMFCSCYVRKPYALFPQETVKFQKKARKEWLEDFTRISHILTQKQLFGE